MACRFGMRLDGWMAPASCVELAVAAEESGFDSIWFAENPFGRGVMPAMVACGLATKRIEIGPGVFNPFNRHPSLIAMEMGALDELLSGRSNLGIGTGILSKLAQANIGSAKPIAAMRDTIMIVRELMKGDVVNYEGQVFSGKGLSIEFKAPRPDYPIFMASMGDQSIRLAGELADGVMISNLCTPGFTHRALELIAASDKPRVAAKPLTVMQYAPCVARPDRVDARNFAKTVLGKMIGNSFSEISTPTTRAWHVMGSGFPEEHFIDMARRMASGEPAEKVVSDEVLDLYVVAGNADDCLAAYQRYLDVGVSEMVVTFRGPEPLAEMKYLADALKSLK